MSPYNGSLYNSETELMEAVHPYLGHIWVLAEATDNQ